MFCVGSWKELREKAAELEQLDAAVYGVSADTVADARALADKLKLPFVLLSDPELLSAEILASPTSTTASFWATAPAHPRILRYPKKAFLQPALFVWTKKERPAYEWRQTEKLRNLLGATGRPGAADIVSVVRRMLDNSDVTST